jgi:hypothetical protein
MYGKIESINIVDGFGLENIAPGSGQNGASLGLSSMLNSVFNGRSMDGYEVKTEKHTIRVLIDNGQSCCESWGYFSSDDDLSGFVGADLRDIELTDKALKVESLPNDVVSYDDKTKIDIYGGGIQFVTFKTDRGDFQLAVYNSHNGYYGHGIIVSVDEEIRHDDTL